MYNKVDILEQYVQCIWDKDTDDMTWYPGEIDECGRKYRDNIVISNTDYFLHN